MGILKEIMRMCFTARFSPIDMAIYVVSSLAFVSGAISYLIFIIICGSLGFASAFIQHKISKGEQYGL